MIMMNIYNCNKDKNYWKHFGGTLRHKEIKNALKTVKKKNGSNCSNMAAIAAMTSMGTMVAIPK